MKFRARIWRSGTSNVLTVPAAMMGIDYKLGDQVIVELQPPANHQEQALNAVYQAFAGNSLSSSLALAAL